jgi:hypothetical protein
MPSLTRGEDIKRVATRAQAACVDCTRSRISNVKSRSSGYCSGPALRLSQLCRQGIYEVLT